MRPVEDAGPVVVQELHVRVTERRVPLPWTAYAMADGCGGALTPAVYEVDLDADRPAARPVDGVDVSGAAGEVKELPAPRLPIRWRLAIRWCCGSRRGPPAVTATGTWNWPGRAGGRA
ncbi:hypothetical protein QCN29_00310 [Streptomyces sp. HNM0663]|uniref:Uncharacterized protein n=1 Tax=Streptomyces chengmaiensis TaxID=3040919 RepID=A0ABT6HER4_9ACTN|nr:hypothetical protein [Streptomyces chengmaiensis]MDH2387251.1 hypothetical protein [Streptomyces chengmaiensis]